MRTHLISVLYLGSMLIASFPPAHAQGIAAIHTSDGRVVYENAESKPTPAADATSTNSGLEYWSNTAHGWKPVPPMYSHSRRRAQTAADEVRYLIRRAAQQNSSLVSSGNALTLASEQLQDRKNTSTTAQNLPSSSRMKTAAAPQWSTTSRPVSFAGMQSPVERQWIDSLVDQAASRHDVDPNLVRAIIKVESNFNPHAVSRKGAVGLMQLMPGTAKSLNVSNPYDPRQNLDAGVRHFKQLLDSYHGNVELSLAAYNAGATAVQRSRGIPNFGETRNYVQRITDIYGSKNTARLFGGHPLQMKRDAEGHLSISDID
jgi:hypothetical protein